MSYNVGGLRLERPFRIRRLGHFGYHSPDIVGTVDFLSKTIGLIPSDTENLGANLAELSEPDRIAWFLRCGTDHHTVVLASQKLLDAREPTRQGIVVGQLSWQVGSLAEVVSAVDYLGKHAKLRRIGRDTPGSNWHAYAYDPDGYVNEVFYGMEQIGWDGRSKPRSMYDRGFKTLPDLPQISECTEVDAALKSQTAGGGYRWQEERESTYDVEGVWMPQPFKAARLGRVTLFVSDMGASLAFYQGVLGLHVSERIKVDGHECVFLRVDDEHHTLALIPKALQENGKVPEMAAGYSLALPSYQQMLDARRYFEKKGARVLDMPDMLSPSVHYSTWVQGPDQVPIQLYYGMDRIGIEGAPTNPESFPCPVSEWPESIVHGGTRWYEPPIMGPLA